MKISNDFLIVVYVLVGVFVFTQIRITVHWTDLNCNMHLISVCVFVCIFSFVLMPNEICWTQSDWMSLLIDSKCNYLFSNDLPVPVGNLKSHYYIDTVIDLYSLSFTSKSAPLTSSSKISIDSPTIPSNFGIFRKSSFDICVSYLAKLFVGFCTMFDVIMLFSNL